MTFGPRQTASLAQRPLQSITIATCRGNRSGEVEGASRRSDAEEAGRRGVGGARSPSSAGHAGTISRSDLPRRSRGATEAQARRSGRIITMLSRTEASLGGGQGRTPDHLQVRRPAEPFSHVDCSSRSAEPWTWSLRWSPWTRSEAADRHTPPTPRPGDAGDRRRAGGGGERAGGPAVPAAGRGARVLTGAPADGPRPATLILTPTCCVPWPCRVRPVVLDCARCGLADRTGPFPLRPVCGLRGVPAAGPRRGRAGDAAPAGALLEGRWADTRLVPVRWPRRPAGSTLHSWPGTWNDSALWHMSNVDPAGSAEGGAVSLAGPTVAPRHRPQPTWPTSSPCDAAGPAGGAGHPLAVVLARAPAGEPGRPACRHTQRHGGWARPGRTPTIPLPATAATRWPMTRSRSAGTRPRPR